MAVIVVSYYKAFIIYLNSTLAVTSGVLALSWKVCQEPGYWLEFSPGIRQFPPPIYLTTSAKIKTEISVRK